MTSQCEVHISMSVSRLSDSLLSSHYKVLFNVRAPGPEVMARLRGSYTRYAGQTG